MNLKEKLLSGATLHGCWANMGSNLAAEILERSGFEWILVDLEHGAGDHGMMYQQLQAIESTGATAVVRTEELSRPKSQRILDAGAYGIMFPRIETAEEAAFAISTMYYPPDGERGMAKMVRATGYGSSAGTYMKGLKDLLLGIIQVETISAVDQIEDIAKLPGVDVLFVGPSDLSLALGIFGQFNHETFQQAIGNVSKAAKKHGKALGVLLQDINEYDMYYKLGFRFIACGADTTFVARGGEMMAKQLAEKKNSSEQNK